MFQYFKKSIYNQLILHLITNDKIEFDSNYFKELIWKCDINKKTTNDLTPILFLIQNNHSKNINLKTEDIYKLLLTANLEQEESKNRYMLLAYVFGYNNIEKLGLTNQQLKNLYDKCKDKQLFFENILTMYNERNYTNVVFKNNKFLPPLNQEIMFLLYECEIEVSQKNKDYLESISVYDVLEMVKKRDVFLNLNKDLKSLDINHKKVVKL
jgi:hypothetical protein